MCAYLAYHEHPAGDAAHNSSKQRPRACLAQRIKRQVKVGECLVALQHLLDVTTQKLD